MFLPGESQGCGSLVGCRLWGHTESDTTEATWQQEAAIGVGVRQKVIRVTAAIKTTGDSDLHRVGWEEMALKERGKHRFRFG